MTTHFHNDLYEVTEIAYQKLQEFENFLGNIPQQTTSSDSTASSSPPSSAIRIVKKEATGYGGIILTLVSEEENTLDTSLPSLTKQVSLLIISHTGHYGLSHVSHFSHGSIGGWRLIKDFISL